MTPDALLSRITTVLRDLPGAEALYLFGSAADPQRRDSYSDLDLQIITADFARSRPAWPWILTKAGEMNLAYLLSETSQESVYSITFTGESLYHKVDIGLSDYRQEGGLIERAKKKVCLWQQPPQDKPVLAPAPAALFPQPGTPLYFLIGEMLSAVRYLKARKRGQHLTCWRFLSARFNALLRCYMWEPGDLKFPAASLRTWDFTDLDRLLPEPERLRLLEMINCRSPQDMDSALLDLTRRIADRVYPSYTSDDTPEAHLVREYFAFLLDEMGLSRTYFKSLLGV